MGWRMRKIKRVRLIGQAELTVVVGETEFKISGKTKDPRKDLDRDGLIVKVNKATHVGAQWPDTGTIVVSQSP